MKATRFQTDLFHRLTEDERNWQPPVLPCATVTLEKSGAVRLCQPLLTTMVNIPAEQYTVKVRAALAYRGLADGLDCVVIPARMSHEYPRPYYVVDLVSARSKQGKAQQAQVGQDAEEAEA